jgi:DNA-binding XRE family transcriptional regulator
MEFTNISDQHIINEITNRVKQQRLNLNMTQSELAKKAGLHVQTIKNFELGKSTKLKTFIQILRVFGALNSLDKLLPETGISPVELLKLKGKVRERASGEKKDDKEDVEW